MRDHHFRLRANRKWLLGAVAIICLNLLVLGLNYRRFFSNSVDTQRTSFSAYDSQIRDFPEIISSNLNQNWQLLVVAVVSANNPDSKLNYIQVLHQRYKERGLAVLAVHQGSEVQGDYVKQRFALSFPVISDKSRETLQSLGISSSRNVSQRTEGLLIIDSNHRVKYSDSRLPSEDQLRILVEKYLLGTVDYSYRTSQARKFFVAGKTIPGLKLRLLGSVSETMLGGKELAGMRLAVFTADCASCQLEKYVKELAAFEASESETGKSILALFAPNFSANDLQSYVERYNVRAPIYMLSGSPAQLHDEYVTRYRVGEAEPMLVSFDGGGRVEMFESLSTHPSDSKDTNSPAPALSPVSQVFGESVNGSARLRKDRDGNFYILNVKDSSILVYDRDFKFVRRVGGFGQGPGDLRQPVDFTIDRDSNLIVADTDNNRVQVFSAGGERTSGFAFEEPLSVDVLSTGEILVVGQDDQKLITVCSPVGAILRSIGGLVPTDAEKEFPRLHRYLNRGTILVDKGDNIYWAGCNLPSPRIRKYAPDGKLVQEFNPTGSQLDDVAARAQRQVRESIESRLVRALATLQGIRLDETNGDIWVLPGAPQLLVYDADGNFKHEIRVKTGSFPLGARDVLILNRDQFVISNLVLGCYRFSSSGLGSAA